MAKKNLFDKAAKKPATKKSDHVEVLVPKMEADLKRMAEINAKKAELEAEYAGLDAGVRAESKGIFVDLYNDTKKFPGTLQMVANTMGFQFITMDKYLKVDADRVEELQKAYGKDVITETSVYSFNTEILVKYMDHISELLMESDVMTDTDKEKLLECTTTIAITKGTISDLFSLKGVKDDVEAVIEDIQPIVSIKAIKEV